MWKSNFHNRGQSLIGIIVILIVIGLLGSGLYYYSVKQIPEIHKIYEISETLDISEVEKEIIQNKVFYIINKGPGNIEEYQVEIVDESTVFSLLEELAAKENFEIETTLYPEMGILVESINGFKGGNDNKWWQYWVNDKLGEVAADRKKIKGDDVIEWKFDVSPEF